MTMRPLGRAIPAGAFAVLRDRERDTVVDSGIYDAMLQQAAHFNREYQSTAYVAELWRDTPSP